MRSYGREVIREGGHEVTREVAPELMREGGHEGGREDGQEPRPGARLRADDHGGELQQGLWPAYGEQHQHLQYTHEHSAQGFFPGRSKGGVKRAGCELHSHPHACPGLERGEGGGPGALPPRHTWCGPAPGAG